MMTVVPETSKLESVNGNNEQIENKGDNDQDNECDNKETATMKEYRDIRDDDDSGKRKSEENNIQR